MSRSDLEYVRNWAIAKLSGCQDSVYAGSEYKELRESVEFVLAKIDSSMPPLEGLLLRPAPDRK
jgi:hypothetical protein